MELDPRNLQQFEYPNKMHNYQEYQQTFARNNQYIPPANTYQKGFQQSIQQYEQQNFQGNCQQWVASVYDCQKTFQQKNEQNYQSNNPYYPPANDYQKCDQQNFPGSRQQGFSFEQQNYSSNLEFDPIPDSAFELLSPVSQPEVSMGGLMPVDYQRTDECYEDEQNNDNSFGNNNNNNNFNGNVPQETFKLGKIPDDFEFVECKLLPTTDEKELIKTRNKEYSAKCLKKKTEAWKTGMEKSTQLIRDHEALQFDNKCQEFKLEFAIKQVLLPVLTGNNANIPFNENDLNQQLQEFERDKQNIYERVNKERMENNEVSEKEEAYAKAQKNFDIADYNLKNKKVMAKKLNVKEATIGSRRTRANYLEKTALFEYQIIWYKYEMDSQRQISRILEWNLNRLRPWVKNVLEDFRGDLFKLYNECRMEAQEAEAMRFFLYRDAG